MFLIPAIEEKKDRRKPTVTAAHNASGFVVLQPDLYIVQQHPLSVLYGFVLDLPATAKITSINNDTDAVSIALETSLGGLVNNTAYRKFNALYTLLNATDKTVTVEIVIFTKLTGTTTDISLYTDQGWILQQVNLTGHIATFSSMVRSFILDSLYTTKIEYPIPAALTFTKTADLSETTPQFQVYNIPTTVGQADYVLYNNKIYSRARSTIPTTQTFTTRANGGLLWI